MTLLPAPKEDTRSATVAPTLWLMLMCSALFVVTAYATDPSWWGTLGNSTPHAVATQGQLKWFTQKAVDDLNAHLTNTTLGAGAGDTLSNLVAGWADDYSTNGYTALNPKPSDKQIVTIGQVKYIASLYYGRLSEAGYTAAWPSWLYPDPAQDANAAVVGQLKTLFNFDITSSLATPGNVASSIQSNGDISVSWQDSSLNVTGYTIEVSTDGTTWTTAGTTTAGATSFTYTPATGTSGSVQVRVKANNGNGTSSGSSTSTASSTSVPTPGAVTDLSGYLDPTGSGDMHLTWSPVTGASAFEIDRQALDGSGWSTIQSSTGSTTYADSTRTTGLGYRYRVKALSAVGGTSQASAPFPQAKYAIIDLGANATPQYLNNLGSVVYSATGGYTFWKGGVTNAIPAGFFGLNNNDMMMGSQSTGQELIDEEPYSVLVDSDYTPPGNDIGITTEMPATWSPTTGVVPYDTDTLSGHFVEITGLGDWLDEGSSYWWTMGCSLTALSDVYVVGTAQMLQYSPYNFSLAADENGLGHWSYYEFGHADACIQWPSGAILGGIVFEPGNNFTWNPPRTPDQPVFIPQAVNNSGLMIGSYQEFDSYGATTSGVASWDGASFASLNPFPDGTQLKGLNNAGSIIGVDDSGYGFVEGGGVPVNIPGTVIPVQINNPPSSVSSYGQILDNSGWVWTYDATANQYQPQNIADYVPGPDDGPWASASVSSMNDYGALIGTASKVKDDSGSPITPVSHGVLLEPLTLEAVEDTNGNYTVDDTDNVLKYVRFGLWDHAFTTTGTVTVLDGSTESTNFVGSDCRRFYLRVKDPYEKGKGTINVDWYTLKSDGTDDDHPGVATITLTETGSNTGVFVSKAVMLVADDVDNAQHTDPGSGNSGGALGAANHRLRRAMLGDKMCFSYTMPGAQKVTASLPLFSDSGPDKIKTMTVQVANLYQGSSFTSKQSDSYIHTIETNIKARYAVAGIKINFNYQYGTPADWLSIPSTDNIDLNAVEPQDGSSSGDEGKLAAIVKAKYSRADSHTLFLILIQQFARIGDSDSYEQNQGEAFSDGLIAAVPTDSASRYCCFAARLGLLSGSSTTCVPSHELGHLLYGQTASDIGSNGNHYNGAQMDQNLMRESAGDPTPGIVTGSRRLWDDASHTAHSHDYQIDYMRQSPLIQ